MQEYSYGKVEDINAKIYEKLVRVEQMLSELEKKLDDLNAQRREYINFLNLNKGKVDHNVFNDYNLSGYKA